MGIGLPSTAANLARLTHAPDVVLVYESGPIGAKPFVLPLSIGDGDLAETADTVVSTPEIFRYWLQGGSDRRWVSGSGPTRPLREHQHDRGRPLFEAKDSAPGSRGRSGDQLFCQGGFDHREALQANARRKARFRNFGGIS